MTAEADIREREKLRCKSLVSRDIAALDAMLSSDLVHIHGSGAVDDKAGYLKGIAEKYDFHVVERGELSVRVYDNIAVVTGPLMQVISLKGDDERRAIDAMTSQVWRLVDGAWQQTTCHNQFLPRG